jgi:hypothetical protein
MLFPCARALASGLHLPRTMSKSLHPNPSFSSIPSTGIFGSEISNLWKVDHGVVATRRKAATDRRVLRDRMRCDEALLRALQPNQVSAHQVWALRVLAADKFAYFSSILPT